MQPKPSLIETQKALATSVRLAHAQPLNGYACLLYTSPSPRDTR